MSNTGQYDLLVIGGGVNGAGIARDAAGRGLSVLLVEQNDLASATSSHSSKLVHGGLRYLETYQFRLVRESLQEREVLLRLAPHIIWPLRFVLPHVPSMRPRWLLSAGLWLYDHLGGQQSLPRSHSLELSGTAEGQALQSCYTHAFTYSDCWVEDMRLVVLNAVDAATRGAVIRTRTKVTALTAQGRGWRVRLFGDSGQDEVQARVVVNAAGPWVGELVQQVLPLAKPPVRLVKGSHLVLPRLSAGDWAYLCQNHDGRVVFALPFERDFTLLGTTDVPYTGDPAAVSCSVEEDAYLLELAGKFFKHTYSSHSIIHRFSGIRALYDNGKSSAKDVTRDYVLQLENTAAPLLSVYGGKITTYRKLAEHALEKLAPHFPGMKPHWSATAPLPGGDLAMSYAEFTAQQALRYPWLPPALLQRYCRLYGTRLSMILGAAQSVTDLGQELAPGLHEAEADYLRAHEFAHTLEDMLWRRTRLGLRLGKAAPMA